MILLFGSLGDPVVAFLAQRLEALGDPACVIDSRRLRTDLAFSFAIGSASTYGHLDYGRTRIALETIRSIYVRGTSPSSGFAPPDQFDLALAGLFETVDCAVLHRPSIAATNASKPTQLQTIAQFGFSVPRTLLTNVPDEARNFYEQCGGRVVYKSASAWRSIVRRLEAVDLGRLDEIRSCPVQFQEYVAGDDIRVHVVRERVFATLIRSDAIDYRFPGREGKTREMRPIELPRDAARRCVELVSRLGLLVGGVDLRETPEGEHVCFEVNPSPEFTFFQRATGQRIGEAIADLLRNETLLEKTYAR
jgi:glutathione synthase/RimK-type ligase-like ATP-grasp enzyme